MHTHTEGLITSVHYLKTRRECYSRVRVRITRFWHPWRLGLRYDADRDGRHAVRARAVCACCSTAGSGARLAAIIVDPGKSFFENSISPSVTQGPFVSTPMRGRYMGAALAVHSGGLQLSR